MLPFYSSLITHFLLRYKVTPQAFVWVLCFNKLKIMVRDLSQIILVN
jgi:hypothetical protein